MVGITNYGFSVSDRVVYEYGAESLNDGKVCQYGLPWVDTFFQKSIIDVDMELSWI